MLMNLFHAMDPVGTFVLGFGVGGLIGYFFGLLTFCTCDCHLNTPYCARCATNHS